VNRLTTACRAGAVWLVVLAAAANVPRPATAATPGVPFDAPTRSVSSAVGFETAVAALRDTGGTIILEPHRYMHTLDVGPRSGGMLTIVGRPGVRVQSILLDHTRDVTVRHTTIYPMTADGGLHAEYSSDITVRNDTFTARSTRFVVELNLDHSDHVAVRDSDFSHCGDNTPEWALCLLPRWARNVTVRHNRFHDCRGCDFIHGRAGANLRILRNHFERALACHHSWIKCGHQDAIELFNANGLLVSRNIFGVTQLGGAQLYMAESTNHVLVKNNRFIRTDPQAPGIISRVGILVGTRISTVIPHDVTIENNTVLSGRIRPDHDADSIVLSPRYAAAPARKRPVIANNIFARQLAPRRVCGLARLSTHNVVEQGTACGATDVVGDAALNARGRPTAGSALVIDQANPVYAPARDLVDHRRVGPPDIGCYEYVPS
jgi:hypothetical protein